MLIKRSYNKKDRVKWIDLEWGQPFITREEHRQTVCIKLNNTQYAVYGLKEIELRDNIHDEVYHCEIDRIEYHVRS